MDKIFISAKAKINISLDVLYKRPDGYHEVEMIMQSISLSDMLTLELTADGQIHFECSHPQVPRDGSNLIIKAARKLKQKVGKQKGVRIKLKKNIPLGAGLAGGSTDAAAALTALNRLWELDIKVEELMEIGGEIGADVPFCIRGGTCLAKGKGEILTELSSLPPHWVLLLVFPFNVSTAEIYGAFRLVDVRERPETEKIIKALKDGQVDRINEYTANVLESVTLREYPQVAERKRELIEKGLSGVLMTGSGPTLFCLSTDKNKLEEAAKSFKLKGEKVIISRTASLGKLCNG